MNYTTSDTVSPCEVPQCTESGIFKQVITILLNLVHADSAALVWIVSNIMWAAVQHRIALHLTAPFRGLGESQRKSASNSCDLQTRELATPPLIHLDKGIFFYASCCLLHLVLYFDFVKCDTPLGSQPPEAFFICLMLLLLPHRLYAEWPITSKAFLVSWAHIWSRSINMAYAGMIPPSSANESIANVLTHRKGFVFLIILIFLIFCTYIVLGHCRAILLQRVKKSLKISRALLWFQRLREKHVQK